VLSASRSNGTSSASAIVAAADKALYRAKSSGRDRVEVYSAVPLG
jgi:PleD family two-component response regulator